MSENAALRAVRIGMRMSQDEFAEALRGAGATGASKRTVQRWEKGLVTSPQARQMRALERVTRLPFEVLGFELPAPAGTRVADDGRGGHDVHVPAFDTATVTGRRLTGPGARSAYSGVWLSRYEYYSSGRDGTFTGFHYVVIIQHGDRLTARSVEGSADSSLAMDMTVDGPVLTGTWVEQTAPDSYYRGARYHGAIQMLAEPTGRRIVGKWVGFGKEMDVNTGPWELLFQDPSTSRATLERYRRPPVD